MFGDREGLGEAASECGAHPGVRPAVEGHAFESEGAESAVHGSSATASDEDLQAVLAVQVDAGDGEETGVSDIAGTYLFLVLSRFY